MKLLDKILLLAFGLCLALSLQAQPKREFRAAWLTTVWGIDWPTSYSQSTEEGKQKQQNELRAIVDSLAEANMNAVFFQVRGFSDAMYKSQYEPWSQYLTGTRGGEPTYDPLQLLIDYAHAKGIEVHAWMNPYRYSSSDATYGKNHEKDYHNTHPEWLVKCGALTILNPSLPEVREQICRVVADVVENYDIDGLSLMTTSTNQGIKMSTIKSNTTLQAMGSLALIGVVHKIISWSKWLIALSKPSSLGLRLVSVLLGSLVRQIRLLQSME